MDREWAGDARCQAAPVGADCQDASEVQRKVALRVGAEACGGERKKPLRRGEAAGMGGVPWKQAVLLEVHKGAGKLDEALVKAAVGVVAL